MAALGARGLQGLAALGAHGLHGLAALGAHGLHGLAVFGEQGLHGLARLGEQGLHGLAARALPAQGDEAPGIGPVRNESGPRAAMAPAKPSAIRIIGRFIRLSSR